MFLSKRTPIVGLDIGTNNIKVTKLKRTGSGFVLENFGMIQLPNDTIVDNVIQDPEIVVQAIKDLFKSEKIKTRNVATGISGEFVVIKKISLPQTTDEGLAESIRIEAEQYIPFDIDDVNIDYQIIKNSDSTDTNSGDEEENNIEVLLVAAKKEIIEERINVITEAGLDPVVIDIDVFAIENAFDINYKKESEKNVIALVNIGAALTNINIIENGITAFTKDIPVGGIYLTQSIQDLLGVTFEIAENIKLGIEVEGFHIKDIVPTLISSTETISEEINKAFEFYSTAANKEIDKIYLSGGCAGISGIDEIFEKNLKKPVYINDPFKEIKINHKKFDPEYIEAIKQYSAISLGLAIRRFYDR